MSQVNLECGKVDFNVRNLRDIFDDRFFKCHKIDGEKWGRSEYG